MMMHMKTTFGEMNWTISPSRWSIQVGLVIWRNRHFQEISLHIVVTWIPILPPTTQCLAAVMVVSILQLRIFFPLELSLIPVWKSFYSDMTRILSTDAYERLESPDWRSTLIWEPGISLHIGNVIFAESFSTHMIRLICSDVLLRRGLSLSRRAPVKRCKLTHHGGKQFRQTVI